MRDRGKREHLVCVSLSPDASFSRRFRSEEVVKSFLEFIAEITEDAEPVNNAGDGKIARFDSPLVGKYLNRKHPFKSAFKHKV